MKIKYYFNLMLLGLAVCSLAEEKLELKSKGEITESAFKVVPLITSSPLLGTGLGASSSYLYSTSDDSSSKSQLTIGGQYSNTDSYNIFANNNAFFNDNKIISKTMTSFANINNDFESSDENIEYNVRSIRASQLLLFKILDSFYLGGQISYRHIKNDPLNDAGADFLQENGIVDENSGEFGFVASYDTRKNKYYPKDSVWVSCSLNLAPSALGTDNSYYYSILNARYYATGFKEDDVWAWQFYAQQSSRKTPDSALPTLSGKSLLRGFPAGQFRARIMSGVQTEYRYQIPDSRFRVTAFVGAARLSGNSYGVDGASRDDDGWYSAAGVGLRYAIQPKTGVDLRLDLVTNSEGVESLYLMLNQAF